MSFCKTTDLIEEGHTAIVYLSFSQLYPIKVTRGLSHHTQYGQLKHSDIIGKKYGTRFKCTNGFAYVLQGSPEIWTISLPHRTQIIYTPNISVISLQLELKPGSVVVESGTGSGSLSHALIRSIFPTGHLHTFEFHLERSQKARKEFEEHGLSEYATVYHRDACTDGFGLEDVADAVFLDLPSPWKALESAKNALKREGGRICSFSPCIEQVQKAVLELTRLGFTQIYTIESLRRVSNIKKVVMQDFQFDDSPNTVPKSQSEAKTEEMETESKEQVTDTKNGDPAKPLTAKNGKRNKKNSHRGGDAYDDSSDDDIDGPSTAIYSAKPINIQPGHTGFLTFATLLHKDFAQSVQVVS